MSQAPAALLELSPEARESVVWYEIGDAANPVRSKKWHRLGELVRRPNYRFGPEVGFAESVAGSIVGRFGFIRVSFDGTGLSQSTSSDWHPESRGELYARLLMQVKAALGDGLKSNRNCLGGFFWIQGETDAKSGGPGFVPRQPESALNYASGLELLITRLRADLDTSELPVFVVSLSTPYRDNLGREFRYLSEVRSAQLAAAEKLSDVYLVSAEELARMPDGLHYSAQGQWDLGFRMGALVKKSVIDRISRRCGNQ